MTPKEKRKLIFDKYDGCCSYCGDELQKGWHVDEVLPVRRRWKYKRDENGLIIYKNHKPVKKHFMTYPERLNIDNQMPSCPSCNINKHSDTLEEFREHIAKYVKSLNNYSPQYRIAKKYGLITETNKGVKFYFEKL